MYKCRTPPLEIGKLCLGYKPSCEICMLVCFLCLMQGLFCLIDLFLHPQISEPYRCYPQ